MIRNLFVLFIAVLACATARPAAPARPELPGYRTPETAEAGKLVERQGGAGWLGLRAETEKGRLVVRDVLAGSPADKAGVRVGDAVARVDGAEASSPERLREVIQARGPGERLVLSLLREGKAVEVAATLIAGSRPVMPEVGKGKGKGKGGFGFAPPPVWKKPGYKLGVVLIEFPDAKMKFGPRSWEEAFFSSGYRKSATGHAAFGSMADYWAEQSCGKLKLEGKAFDPVMASKKRGDWVEGSGTSNKTALPSEILGKLVAREPKALEGLDGVCFIYAGANRGTNRGSLYSPHQGSLSLRGKRIDYILCPEGNERMEPIGTFAVEFGKLLGLPSLAARTENAGSEGLGKWCLMSDGGTGARPGQLSAWCKERLGWLTPTIIDPTKKQKLVLGPVQSSPRECFKVLLRADGSEYFLLENRTALGFDASLPAHGLLIWRVSGGRPTLEESHGVAGPSGPKVHLESVPWPSKSGRAFTPKTTPSSRSEKGGGWAVHLTGMRRVVDGRVAFRVGWEYE